MLARLQPFRQRGAFAEMQKAADLVPEVRKFPVLRGGEDGVHVFISYYDITARNQSPEKCRARGTTQSLLLGYKRNEDRIGLRFVGFFTKPMNGSGEPMA